MRSRAAKASMQASARSPMPRRGVLMMRVGQHPQVGQGVLDLLALVEADAAHDPVRQADPDEDLLEHA
jgi:hypothetical protein